MNPQATAAQRAVQGEWTQRMPLQIDSYATGQQLAHAHVFHDGSIEVEVTDGNARWKVKLRPPPEWNP